MQANRFAGVLLAAALVGNVLAEDRSDGVRLLVQGAPLAGFRYHAAAEVWHELRVGDTLQLEREPHNPHDANAIAVTWRGRKLGYVPRRDNAALAWGLDTPRVHAILAAASSALGDAALAAFHLQRHIELVTTKVVAAPALATGTSQSLGLLPGRVVRFEPAPGLKIPHMGWNTLRIRRPAPILEGLGPEPSVYFVHSYRAVPDRPEDVAAEADYPNPFAAMVWRDNLMAC